MRSAAVSGALNSKSDGVGSEAGAPRRLHKRDRTQWSMAFSNASVLDLRARGSEAIGDPPSGGALRSWVELMVLFKPSDDLFALGWASAVGMDGVCIGNLLVV